MKKRVSGWITPSGKFHECGMYEHANKVASIPELYKLVPDLDDKLNTLRDIEEDCCHAGDVGEHPAWHNYEMYECEVRWQTMDTLKKAGCLRVGTWDKVIHFEGTPNPATFQAAKDLANSYDMKAVFE